MIIEQEKQKAVRKAVEEMQEMRKEAKRSERDKDILRMLLHGSTVAETAKKFDVSEQEIIELIS